VGILDAFATSGPYEALLEYLGLTVDNIVAAGLRVVARREVVTQA
jgi:transketolase